MILVRLNAPNQLTRPDTIEKVLLQDIPQNKISFLYKKELESQLQLVDYRSQIQFLNYFAQLFEKPSSHPLLPIGHCGGYAFVIAKALVASNCLLRVTNPDSPLQPPFALV